jgi:nucleoid DNA-binding protein
MNKRDLINSLTKVLSTKREASNAVQRMFGVMRDRMRSGEKVVISGFGSFNVKMYRAKKIKNPKTGKEMLVQPRRRVRFKPSKYLLG